MGEKADIQHENVAEDIRKLLSRNAKIDEAE